MTSKEREVGKQGLVVSPLGLGCVGMSQSYGPLDDAESIATVRRAIELGINFIDTADAYGLGHNERLIAQALGSHRNSVVVATKFGVVGSGIGHVAVDGSPRYAKLCCEASLRRLGTETIDLYYLHRVDPKVPIEDTVGAMAELVVAGKVLYLGLSEASPTTIRRAHSVHPISALQSEWSLFNREPEASVLPTVRELGIGFVPFSPLGRGFLTGKFTDPDAFGPNDLRSVIPRFYRDNFAHNLGLVERLSEIAARVNCTPGQLSLAWLLAQGTDVIPIPGTKSRRHLEENNGALEVELSSHDLAELDGLFPLGSVAGARYEDMSDIDTSS